jgi:hypothetical protein
MMLWPRSQGVPDLPPRHLLAEGPVPLVISGTTHAFCARDPTGALLGRLFLSSSGGTYRAVSGPRGLHLRPIVISDCDEERRSWDGCADQLPPWPVCRPTPTRGELGPQKLRWSRAGRPGRAARVAARRYLGWHLRAEYEVENGTPRRAAVRDVMNPRAWMESKTSLRTA